MGHSVSYNVRWIPAISKPGFGAGKGGGGCVFCLFVLGFHPHLQEFDLLHMTTAYVRGICYKSHSEGEGT